MGIAVDEGYVHSVNDPISKYIPEFSGTGIADVPINACLQMASGLDFDEESDLSKFSMKTLLGVPEVKILCKLSLKEAPFTSRQYLSINTEILGEIISNAAGMGLADYIRQKLWSKSGPEQDAYWTLSNGKELAMGGLSISLRDFARFGRLYLKGEDWNAIDGGFPMVLKENSGQSRTTTLSKIEHRPAFPST